METSTPLPAGTVTFLFTDIEGSTQLWEQQPEAMRADLARHDALLRAAIESHGGHVFKTMGDQFCAVFAHARDAVRVAIEAQCALYQELPQLRVRMALHTGAAEMRQGDYFGPPVNRVARLLAAGHGGQVLLSQATAELLRESLPPDLRLSLLGTHRLRDIADRETIFHLLIPGLPSEFPPLNTLDVAFRRGMARAAAVSAVVVAVVASLALLALNQARLARRAAVREAQQRTRAERLLYVADMSAAQQAIETGNFGHAVDLLKEQVPGPHQEERRGFEWRYLWRLCQDQSRRTFRGHAAWLSDVAFSPDGKTIASGSMDEVVKVWEVTSGRIVATFKGSGCMAGFGATLAFSPDGKMLAVGTRQGTVKLWDTARKQVVATLQGAGRKGGMAGFAVLVAFSPDGKTLAAGRMNGLDMVTLWDVASRQPLGRLRGDPKWEWIPCIAFTPDGKTLAVCGGEHPSVKLWGLAGHPPKAGWREVATLRFRTMPVLVSSVTFSPDSKRLAVGGTEKVIGIWDLASRRVVTTFPRGPADIWCMEFSPDGKTLATGSMDNRVTLWDTVTRKQRAVLHGHDNAIMGLAFSPDSQLLATASWDRTVKLWDVGARPEEDSILQGHTRAVVSLGFSPDGKILASASQDHTVKLWDLVTDRPVATLPGYREYGGDMPSGSLALSPNGRLLATAGSGDTVHLWELAGPGGRPRTVGRLKPRQGLAVAPLVFSPDGRLMATLSGDYQRIELWDVARRHVVSTLRMKRKVFYIAFSPDGKTLAAGDGNGFVSLFSVPAGQEVVRLHGDGGEIMRMAFSPDGRILAVANHDKTVVIWDVRTRRELATLKGHHNWVMALAFSPDGRTLATGSWDKTVKLWNTATWREAATLKGHTDFVRAVAFSPDGSTLATGSTDTTIRLWRAATFAEPDAPDSPSVRRSSR
jgi:WD40 repeat protein/class 3 adenylate cyclase